MLHVGRKARLIGVRSTRRSWSPTSPQMTKNTARNGCATKTCILDVYTLRRRVEDGDGEGVQVGEQPGGAGAEGVSGEEQGSGDIAAGRCKFAAGTPRDEGASG